MATPSRTNPISPSDSVYVKLQSPGSSETTSKAIQVGPGFGYRNIIPIPYIPNDTESHREYPGSFDGIDDGWCLYGREPDTRYKDTAELMLMSVPAVQAWRRYAFLSKGSTIGRYFPGM